jgi:hypothetical protein
MQKYKTALHQTVTKLAQGIAIWYMAEALSDMDNTFQIWLITFALFWLATDVSVWAYRFIVKPSALAIYKASK